MQELTSLVRYEEEIGPIVLDPTQQPAPISSGLVSPGGSSNPGFSVSLNSVQNSNETSNFYFSTRSLHTISPRYFHYMTKKAHLVLRMLENRIGYSLLLQVQFSFFFFLFTIGNINCTSYIYHTF